MTRMLLTICTLLAAGTLGASYGMPGGVRRSAPQRAEESVPAQAPSPAPAPAPAGPAQGQVGGRGEQGGAPGSGAALANGQPGPNLPRGKAPEQGYVPDAWPVHTGGLLKYRVQIRFGEEPDTMPDGFKFGRASAVSTDALGNVYAFQRGPKADPIIVFDSTGRYLRSWGKGMFGNPHGIRVDRDGNVWCVDNGNQQVYKFANDGTLLQTWGTKGVTGTTDKTFGRPTDIAWDSHGNFYVSDGYGNGRVVKFDKAGNYLTAWGTPGDGPGQFRVVHALAFDSKDRLYVSDRENNRIQIFDVNGKLLRTWTHLGATQGMFITPRDEMWILTHRNNTENITYDTLAGQLMKIDLESGKVLGALESPGHHMTVAADGSIYVASLTGNIFKWSPGGSWYESAGEAPMIVLAVTWIANAGRDAEAAHLFKQLAAESRKEPGCLPVLVHQHRTEPARFLIYEQYEDDAALDAHRAAPYFVQYVRHDLVKVAVRVEGSLYSAL